MNVSNEIFEDLKYQKGYLFGHVRRSYKFSGKYGPVIGIHGVFGGWMPDSLGYFMRQNDVGGKLVSWGSLTRGFETYFPKLDTEIMKYKNPVLLGYSTSGILVILYAERFKAWNRIKKIITIATPFAGVDPKLSLVGKSLREMVLGNSILDEVLNIKPPKDKILSLFANEDKFTPNPEKIKLNWPSIILPAKSHGDIQNHYKWIEKILKSELGIN